MKVIENNLLPLPGFVAINLFGVIFVRKDVWAERSERYRERTLTHEAIHTAQMKELLYVGFYFLYFLEWVWEIVVPPKGAYRWISFEEEAFRYESNPAYLKTRKHFAQWRK